MADGREENRPARELSNHVELNQCYVEAMIFADERRSLLAMSPFGKRIDLPMLCPPSKRMLHSEDHYSASLSTTINHAFGPPSLKLTSLGSGRISYLERSMLWITQPSAKVSRISFLDTRRGPCVPGSSSLKQSKYNRPPGMSTEAIAPT